MISIALQTAIERARDAALSGDPEAFREHLRGIQSLDRSGQIARHELRMLEIVAAARRADLAAVDALLLEAGSLSTPEWDRLRRWLLAAPEAELPAYAGFVRALDQRMRRLVRVPSSRRWTPSIAIVLAGALLSFTVLAWRLGAVDPGTGNAATIEAVLTARPDKLLQQCPSVWRTELLEAGRALATHDTAAGWGATQASIDTLAKAVRDAAAGPSGSRVAEALMGPLATPRDLARVAAGLTAWRDSPWLRVSAWSDESTWSWHPTEDARLAWRVALRHMPLGLWLPGLFSMQWRCEPLRDETVTVVRTSGDATRVSMQAVVGTRNWTIPASRVGRHWVADAIVAGWPEVSAALDLKTCDAARAARCQQSIADGVRAIAGAVDRLAAGVAQPGPAAQEVPWWVP